VVVVVDRICKVVDSIKQQQPSTHSLAQP
jgi:hypothetical protein